MKRSLSTGIYIIITFLVILWCAGIVAAPLLRHAGLTGTADIAYSMFSRVCHQNNVNSFHVEGEKFGVCIRCSAIYFGFLIGLLILPVSGALKRMRSPKPVYIIAVIIPMVIDAVLNDSGLHISTTMTRLATGFLFGSVMPWCIMPHLLEACSQLLHKKKNQ
jgi:uncharacterized membrane protein